jgi:hypothetical protein
MLLIVMRWLICLDRSFAGPPDPTLSNQAGAVPQPGSDPRARRGGLAVQFPRVIVAKFAFHFFEHLLAKLLAAQAPTPAEDLERFLVRFLQSPRFHPPLKLLPTRSVVLLDPVLA